MSEKPYADESAIGADQYMGRVTAPRHHPHIQRGAFFPNYLSEDFVGDKNSTTLRAYGKFYKHFSDNPNYYMYDTYMQYISIKVPAELWEAARLAANLLAISEYSSIFYLTHEREQVYSVNEISIGTIPPFAPKPVQVANP